MKRLHRSLCAALLLVVGPVAIVTTGCGTGLYMAPVRPPTGLFFTQVRAPLTIDFNGNPSGAAATKRSSNSTHYFLQPLPLPLPMDFAWDDVSIKQMADEAGIEEISYADYEILNILGLYVRFTVFINGN